MTFWNNPDLLALTGSHLYGVANKDSDIDLRGFVVPPKEYLSDLPSKRFRFDQYEDPESDTVIYSLKKFFELLINGNTQAIETLYGSNFHNMSDKGVLVWNHREIFLSKKYYRSIKGFAFAERRKALAVKLSIQEKDSENPIHRLCSVYNLKRFQRDAILDMLEEFTGEKIKVEYSSITQLGDSRKQLVEQYGYDIKSAYHCIRLLSQGIELFTDQTITYPRPEVDILRSIRNGEVSKIDFEKMFEELDADLDFALANTKLNKEPNYDAIDKLYMELIK